MVYILLIALSSGMLLFVWSAKGAIPIKTAIQSGIMLSVGAGGLLILVSVDTPKSN
jgi:hypothetical protein